jgi:hypothetical protein
MTLRRYGSTDYQEAKLAQVERLAKSLKFRLTFGTRIGKSPQTVILDHHYQDNFMSISADEKWGIRVDDEKVSMIELKKIMLQTLENERQESQDAKELNKAFGATEK